MAAALIGKTALGEAADLAQAREEVYVLAAAWFVRLGAEVARVLEILQAQVEADRLARDAGDGRRPGSSTVPVNSADVPLGQDCGPRSSAAPVPVPPAALSLAHSAQPSAESSRQPPARDSLEDEDSATEAARRALQLLLLPTQERQSFRIGSTSPTESFDSADCVERAAEAAEEPEELPPGSDQGALKKPQTAFFEFIGDHRETIVKSMAPGSKATEVLRKCSEVWKEMSAAERQPYEDRYRAHKEEYDIEQATLKAKKAAALEAADPLVQRQYRNLACEMEVVPKGSAAWLMIHEYVRGSQVSDLRARTEKRLRGRALDTQLRVSRVVALNRQADEVRFAKHREARDSNRTLLWYGLPLAGWAALLAQGLRLPPSEAPTTGCNFGRGIYFTDLASIAASRCSSTAEDDGPTVLLLAEVALGGNVREAVQADPKADKMSGRCSAVLGKGALSPPPAAVRTLADGLRVPQGMASRREVKGGDLPHNEYVVYNPAQARLRYAVEVVEVSDAEAVALDEEAVAAHTAMPRRLRAKTRAPWEQS